MFSFLSDWRQTFSSSDGDSDVSSLNRSLNLPWPVTESSPRKNKSEATQQQQQQTNGKNVRDISYPMPKKALKSFTRPDDHLTADGLPGPSAPPIGATDTPPLHPFVAAPAPSSESVPWFQESAAKRKNHNLRTALLQANAHAQLPSIPNANVPPEVVRVDSNDAPYPRPQRPPTNYHDDLSHHASYATYVTHPYANGISNPSLYASYPYAHQTSHNGEGDQHEIYASPFGHSDVNDQDGFFRGSHSSQTRTITPTPAARRGGLKLHTASPFSQSTLQVDGLIFPQPPDTTPHRHYHLPDGVLRPSPQPGTPPVPTVNTDVYNHAYNYPLAKQLSPIVEQDYFSPTSVRDLPDSAASASPAADSVLNLGFGNGNGKERVTGEGDKDRERDSERGSTRTRSGRTGSAGSVKAPSTSGSGSGSFSSLKEGTSTNSNPSPSGTTIGFEVSRKFFILRRFSIHKLISQSYIPIIGPSPIYASPFLTRHLNRTVSQTSSNKSESPSQAQSQLPPPPPPSVPVAISVPPPPLTQPQPQEVTQSNSPLTPTLSRMTSQLSVGSSTPRLSTATITPANAFLKLSAPDTTIITTDTRTAGSAPTPTSAATTTTGTMYTPNSAFPAPAPTSPTPGTTGIAGAQIPAITIHPYIPPLDLGPFFPGPHPSLNLSLDSETPRLRPPKKREARGRLSVIQSDAEDNVLTGDDDDDDDDGEEGGGYDVESLHAESFVTATTNNNDGEDYDEKPFERGGGLELTVLPKAKTASTNSSRTHASQLPSTTLHHSGSGNSTGDSFIFRRWDRDAALGLSLSPTTFGERKHRFFIPNSSFITDLTPAFWAFWLGFLFPVLWLVGGWHFTNLGEQPPKSTVWEWYFWRIDRGWWKRVFVEWGCFRVKKGGGCVEGFKNHKRGSSQQQQIQEGPQKRNPRPRTFSDSKLRCGKVFPALPRWVAEKQSTDDGRMRLNDPKRSLKGILFGYPFISRPPSTQGSTLSTPSGSSTLSVMKRVLVWIGKPNRVLDQLYGVKLREVRGRPESGRRMFDPWIQRCRYAFCWIMLVVAIGLCTASVYLIAANTKRL